MARATGEEKNHRKIQNTTIKQNPQTNQKTKGNPQQVTRTLRVKQQSPGDEHQLQIHRHHNSCKTKVVKDFHSVYRSSFTDGPEHSLFIQRSLLYEDPEELFWVLSHVFIMVFSEWTAKGWETGGQWSEAQRRAEVSALEGAVHRGGAARQDTLGKERGQRKLR